MLLLLRVVSVMLVLFALNGCNMTWNSPYPKELQGNIFYTGFSERPKHLDPAKSFNEAESPFVGNIYEPPLQYHYLKRPYTLEPLTLKQMPRIIYRDAQGNVLPDNSTLEKIAYTDYELDIKSGIYYQPHPCFAKETSGKPKYWPLERSFTVNSLFDFTAQGSRELVADDYIYQIKRLADPRLNSPVLGMMEKYIVGLHELNQQLSRDLAQGKLIDLRNYTLAGAIAQDKYRYRIRLKGQYPQFIYWLAMSFFAPVPFEADLFYQQSALKAKNITLDWYPVGTGAFMLTHSDPNQRFILSRNPNFHREYFPARAAITENRLPKLDKIVFTLEKESIPYWNKFQQGYYDTAGVSQTTFDQAVEMQPNGQLQASAALQQRNIRLLNSTDLSTMAIIFNWRDPVVGGDTLAARQLRQAISIAIDVEEQLNIFANGRGIAAMGPIPLQISGNVEINPWVYQQTAQGVVRKPIEVAKQLLAQAGYPQGISRQTGQALVLNIDVVSDSPQSKAYFDWLRQQLAKINVQLIIRNTDANRFYEKLRTGAAQLFMLGWNADYPDPENFLFLFYSKNGKVSYGGENASNYASVEFDRDFEQLQNLLPSPRRDALVARMVARLQADAPWIWGYHPQTVGLLHSWVKDLYPNRLIHNRYKYLSIDVKTRIQAQRAWNHPRWVVLWLLLVIVLGAIAFPLRHRLFSRRCHDA